MKKNQQGYGLAGILVVIVIIGLIGGAGWLVYDRQNTKSTPENNAQSQVAQQDTSKEKPKEKKQVYTEVKSANFVSSMPKNNDNWNVNSANGVSLVFNKPVSKEKSKIEVKKNGVSVLIDGKITSPIWNNDIKALDNGKMSIGTNARDKGNYVVEYTACFTDATCESGSFGFSVDM